MAHFFRSLLKCAVSPITVNNYGARLFAIWRSAAETGAVARGPRVRKLREPRNKPDAWSIDELTRIFQAAAAFRSDAWIGPVPSSLWWVAILSVTYETALRRGSLFAIQPADIDLKAGTLYVDGQDMKDGDGQEYQLSRGTVRALEQIWQPPRKFVFRTDLSINDKAFGNMVGRDFKKILAAAGIQPSRRRSLHLFHKMRRSTATKVTAELGIAAAAALLGHSTEYVTKRYIDKSLLPGRNVTDVLPTLVVA
jgi:integrase